MKPLTPAMDNKLSSQKKSSKEGWHTSQFPANHSGNMGRNEICANLASKFLQFSFQSFSSVFLYTIHVHKKESQNGHDYMK